MNSPHEIDSEALVARAQRGCRESFGTLVDRHQKGLYNFLLQRTRSHDDAEELTQESFVRAWRRLATYRDQWRFTTWLYAVARSVAADRARQRRVGTSSELPEPAVDCDPGLELGAREEGAGLWRLAREVLSEEQHSALWLFYAEDRSAAEIGKILGKQPIAVRVMLFRARGQLGKHLEARASAPRKSLAARRPMETTP